MFTFSSFCKQPCPVTSQNPIFQWHVTEVGKQQKDSTEYSQDNTTDQLNLTVLLLLSKPRKTWLAIFKNTFVRLFCCGEWGRGLLDATTEKEKN